MRKATLFLQYLLPALWLGEILAISFMEAPLKFYAPNVTMALGAGIGKLVFFALNKVEIAFLFLFSATLVVEPAIKRVYYLTGAAAAILLLQSWVLLPLLNERVLLLQHGEVPPASNLHTLYIITDIMKCIVLLLLCWQILVSKGSLKLSNQESKSI